MRQKLGLPSKNVPKRMIRKHRFGEGWSPDLVQWIQKVVMHAFLNAETKSQQPSLYGMTNKTFLKIDKTLEKL